jgi:hypothetical protein
MPGLADVNAPVDVLFSALRESLCYLDRKAVGVYGCKYRRFDR